MYIVDRSNYRIRKVTVSTGIISTIAGTGTDSFSGDNGAATSATLSLSHGMALDAAGSIIYIVFLRYVFIFLSLDNVYIADTINCRIRKVLAATSYPR